MNHSRRAEGPFLKRASWNWRKFKVMMATQFAHMTIYRAEIIIWMLSGTLSLIMGLIWMQQASSAPGGVIGGYSAADFASYFVTAWATAQVLVVWVSWDLSFDIRQGTMSPRLLHPIDPIWQYYVSHWAERLIRLPLMLALAAAFAWGAGAHVAAEPQRWLAYLALVPLGFTLRFLWEYCIGLLAFWMEAADNFAQLTWVAYAALGGLLAPLSLYPDSVQRVAALTPFPYMLGLPCALLTGKASLSDALHGWLILLAWTVGFGLLKHWMWRRGVSKYGAVGA